MLNHRLIELALAVLKRPAAIKTFLHPSLCGLSSPMSTPPALIPSGAESAADPANALEIVPPAERHDG